MKTKPSFLIGLIIALTATLVSLSNVAAQSCLVPPADMVAWLPGDGNPQDIKNNAQDLRVIGNVTYPAGVVAQSFNFDGGSSVTYSTVNAGNSYTVDFWMRPSSAGPQLRQNVIGNGLEPGKFGLITYNAQAKLIEYFQEFATSISHVKVYSAENSVPLNGWTHVALAYDGQMQVNQLYINGLPVGNPQDGTSRGTSPAHVETFNNQFTLGYENGASVNQRFVGQLDEVGIYARVLNPSEIADIYLSGSAGRCKMPVDADNDGVVDGRDACPGTPAGTTVNAAGCPINVCLPPPAGLNHWLPGDGNPQDILSNSDTLNVTGTLAFSPGVVGNAFGFDGSNDVAYSTMTVGNAYTVDFWIRPAHSSQDNSRQNIIGNILNGTTAFGLITFGFQQIEYYQSSATSVNDAKVRSPQIPYDAYTHVALTYDGQVNRLFINGDLVSTSLAHTETFNNPIALAGAVGATGNARFHGDLDEVEIFNRALSQTEIRGIFYAATAGKCKTLVDADGDGVVDIRDACAGTVPGTAVNASGCTVGNCFLPPPNLTNWFPGNGTAADIRGGGNGTIGGGVTFASGKVGNAFIFDGTGHVTYPAVNAGNRYTVDLWVRPTGTAGRQALVSANATNSTGFGAITVTPEGRIEYLQNGAIQLFSEIGSAPPNAYTHVALTYNGEINQLYLNGNLVATSGVHAEVLNHSVRLGWGFDFFSLFQGQIDEVEIFNRVLSPTEIRGIFQAGSAGKCSNGVVDKTLGNISTRLAVQSGENVLIGGLIVVGQQPKRVIIRALGPSLGAAGVAGALQNPTLQLFQGNTLLFENDNWRESQESEIAATGIAPGDDREAAIVRTLAPGNYTAVLRGKDGTTGVALLESYDLEQRQDSKLGNIATRGFVGSGDDVLIGGFIVGPNTRVVVRAIGPSLAAFGIGNPLPDPTLALVDAHGGVVRSNDNWMDSQQADISATGLQPSDNRESAVVDTLAAGNYTAVVKGKDGNTGVAVVEVYNVQ